MLMPCEVLRPPATVSARWLPRTSGVHWCGGRLSPWWLRTCRTVVLCRLRSEYAAWMKMTSGFDAVLRRLLWSARLRLLWLSVTMVVAVESSAPARERSSIGKTDDVQ